MAQTTEQRAHPEFELPIISDSAIRRASHEQRDPLAVEKALATDGNFELTQWLRRRAQELAPDIADKGPLTQLAYEALALVGDQLSIAQLEALFSADTPNTTT